MYKGFFSVAGAMETGQKRGNDERGKEGLGNSVSFLSKTVNPELELAVYIKVNTKRNQRPIGKNIKVLHF